jgi:predicted DNA-binding transcriptional regulator YafY
LAKKSSSKMLHRPPLDRMLRIHQALKSGAYPNASSLSEEMEVCSKSIHRDFDFMRDRLKLPLEFDGARNGWYYTEEVSAFPTLQITEGEIVALVMAEKALQQYRGTSFEKPLISAIQKMEHALPNTISVSLADIEQSISFQSRIEPILNLELIDALAKATAARKQIVISYRKPGQTSAEQRTVDPYHLANINSEWYLFAYDHLRKDIRTFVPARMKSIRQTGVSFKPKGNFSLEKRLRDSFGVHSAEGEFQVVLRFTSQVADYIREKRWHESQELKELKDGGVELKMKLSSLSEVERWVLSWGGNATVVQPSELAGSVKEAAKKLLAGTRK